MQFPGHNPSFWKMRAGTQGKNLEQGAQRNGAYWFVTHGLITLLSNTIQDHMLRGGTVRSELSPPTSGINQENDP